MAIALLGPRARFLKNFADSEAGLEPLAGGLVYTYEAGTTTPKATYTDSSGATANTNPVILDTEGYADIYLGTGLYKIDVKDADGVSLPGFPVDDYEGSIPLLDTITASSSTSVSLGTGTKSFEIEANKAFPDNAWVLVSYDPDPLDHYMIGQVVDYTDTTIEISMSVFEGSGTYNDWTLALSGPPGPEGPQGPAGAGTGDMLKSENLSGLANYGTARGNLGLGSAAVLDVGTTANKVVQLNGSAELPAVSGANLTNLDASDLATGTVPPARLGTGTPSDESVLYGDNVWRPPGPTTYQGVGTYILGIKVGGSVAEGASVAGSGIATAIIQYSGGVLAITGGSSPAGTWRNMGPALAASPGAVGLFVRIA